MQTDDIERLNAFVDGELDAPARAEVAARLAVDPAFARVHATLARLKGCVAELGEPLMMPSMMPRRRWPRAATWAGLAAVGLVGLGFLGRWPGGEPPAPPSPSIGVALTATHTRSRLPDLAAAGLHLTDVAVPPDGGPALIARYRGPRGCRLELRVMAAGGRVPVERPDRRMWLSGDLAYELIAFGMPADRFARIADAARLATLDLAAREPIARLLREARAGVRPCLG